MTTINSSRRRYFLPAGETESVDVLSSDARRRILPPKGSGFSIGYSGTGPTNLAKAILFDLLGEIPWERWADFRTEFISAADGDADWCLEASVAMEWIRSAEASSK